jgi:diguanylate cyclase (GGDEF)-like protein/PAS domain S-box-containing protein
VASPALVDRAGLTALLAHLRGDRRAAGVLVVDIDHCSAVNSSYGHTVGDQVIAAAQDRILTALHDGELVSRIGSNAWAVVLSDVDRPSELMPVAERLQAAFKRQIAAGDREVPITVTVGTAHTGVDHHGGDLVELAFAAARSAPGDASIAHAGAVADPHESAERLRHELAVALDRGEIDLLFQPIVETRTGWAHAVEALVRWHHPERGLVLPGAFLPHVDGTELMDRLTAKVIDDAARQAGYWRTTRTGNLGTSGLRVWVNLSPSQVARPDLLERTVRQALAAHNLEPGSLGFEVFEASADERGELLAGAVRMLRGLGCPVALDDFGTRTSSLTALRELPVTVVKIDHVLLAEESGLSITRSLLDMGRALDLQVVAEGVASAEQLDRLVHLGVDAVQGSHLALPLPAIAVAQTVARRWCGSEPPRSVAPVTDEVPVLAPARAVEQDRRRFEGLIAQAEMPIVLADQGGGIFHMNVAARRLVGLGIGDPVGGLRQADLIHPCDHHRVRERVRPALEASKEWKGRVTWRHQRSGEPIPVDVSLSVVHEPLTGDFVAAVARDLRRELAAERATQRRVAFDALANDLAQMTLEIGPDAAFERLGSLLERIARQLGCQRAAVVVSDTPDVDQTRVLASCGGPVDRALVREAMASAPVVARAHPQLAVRIRTRTGATGVVAVDGAVDGTTDGGRHERLWENDEVSFVRKLAVTIGSMLDQQRLDARVRESELRYRLLTEESVEVVALLDAAGTVAYSSPSAFDVLGRSAESLVGARLGHLIEETHLPRWESVLRGLTAAAATRDHASVEVAVRHANGGRRWIAISLKRMVGDLPAFDRAAGTGPASIRASLRDVTDRRMLQEELERQASHDPLTGLANRALLHDRLAVAAARRARPNPISLLLIDLDGFKAVNDRLGHAAGDEVLTTVAERLGHLTRPSDTLARFGGDEFVLLCPETDLDGAMAIAERIVEAVAEPIHVGGASGSGRGEDVQVGASVGIGHSTGFPPGELIDPDRLLLQADAAMYDAKRAGKGRAVAA